MGSKKKHLDTYLSEVFKQFIAIKDNDYRKSQEVFKGVFDQVKSKMGEKCNYFGKYSSQVMYAGSVADGIKVTKLDEFDMDLVIRLPIHYEEICIEADQPGFVKLKIENAFDNLDKQPEWEKCHKVTREWRDSDKYFLQSKFRQWMHAIVQKALNDMNSKAVVNDVTYQLKYKESGPAWTLNITNEAGNEEFKLDVDLVPVIRFMYPRWPEGYRTVDESIVKEWLVVPKPNKALTDEGAKNRCWRLSFQDFEREMMKGCQQLKTTIRLMKKLRDSLQMKDICSYYIKTLFLWKIDEQKEKKYWHKSISELFRIMVEELYKALLKRNIPYFWHEDNNLIHNVKLTVLKGYSDKVKEVLVSIDNNNPDKLASMLLTCNEYQEFRNTEFYINIQKVIQKQSASNASLNIDLLLFRQESNNSVGASVTDSVPSDIEDQPLVEIIKALGDKIDAMSRGNEKRMKNIEIDLKTVVKNTHVVDLLAGLNDKIDTLISKFDDQNNRLKQLETSMKAERETLENKIDAFFEKLDIQCDALKSHGASNILRETQNSDAKYKGGADLLFENDKILVNSIDDITAGVGEVMLNCISGI